MNNTLVGFSLKNDLKSLLFYHPIDMCEELQEFFIDEKRQPYSLKTLAMHYFKTRTFQNGTHSALQDARMTRKLHIKKLEAINKNPNCRYHHHLSISRATKEMPLEKCRCKRIKGIYV
jgi:DNA polymerase III epsilon subunit-like protein